MLPSADESEAIRLFLTTAFENYTGSPLYLFADFHVFNRNTSCHRKADSFTQVGSLCPFFHRSLALPKLSKTVHGMYKVCKNSLLGIYTKSKP